MRRTFLILISLLTVGCSFGSTEEASHNTQDIEFATDMIPHHAQALEMTRLVEQNNASAEVKALATQIAATQQPEINEMNRLLESWGEKAVDPTATDEHSSHGNAMAGMMSEDQMNKLAKSTGAEFNKMFLEMMVEHHQGAIEMAEKELSKGKHTDALQLARSIIDAQKAEISQMQKLLNS